jgi:hypothetical protein
LWALSTTYEERGFPSCFECNQRKCLWFACLESKNVTSTVHLLYYHGLCWCNHNCC